MAYTFKHGDRPFDGVTIQRAVGRGGFGEVYYARTDSGKEVALKYLRDNPEIELRGVAQVMNLKSPHLITIYDVRRNAEGEPFVVMEYISGPSLHELMLAEGRALGPQKAAFFLAGIAKGLSYLHERGVVHRDLKPGNIFYDEGYVKIGDYGLSKHMSVSRHSGQTASVGTVHYMAPEIGSGSYSKAIDIYAMGVILYEMLTGRLPFTGSSMAEILMRHLQDRPDIAGIPEPFAHVIARARQKNPTDRYQDANEMVDAILSSSEISAGVASFDPRSLSAAPRANLADAQATVTTPPRVVALPPLPDLDARAAAAEIRRLAHVDANLPPIPPIPPMPGEARPAWRDRAENYLRERGFSHEPQGAEHGSAGLPQPFAAAQALGRSRWATVLTIGIVSFAASILIALVTGQRAEAVFMLAFYIAGGAAGAVFANLAVLPRLHVRNGLIDGLVCGACGLVGMLIGLGPGEGRDESLIIVPLALMLTIVDWRSRIEAGRAGLAHGGQVIWPAIVALIAGSILSRHGGGPVSAAAAAAALTFVAQLMASLFPLVQTRAGQSHADGAIPPTGTPRGLDRIDFFASGSSFAPRDSAPLARAAAATPIPLSAAPQAPSGLLDLARDAGSAPVPLPLRVFYRVLFFLTLCGSIALFIAFANERNIDDRTAMLFFALALLASLPFLGSKMLQTRRQPLWRGTFRLASATAGLWLASGMISIIANQRLEGTEFAGAIFGLLVGVSLTGIFLSVTGSLPNKPPDSKSEPAAQSDPNDTTAEPAAPSFAGRTTNAGLALFAKILLLASAAVLIFQHAAPAVPGVRVRVAGPPPIVGFAVGAALLVIARRREGASSIGATVSACLLGVVGMVLLNGPAADGIRMIASRGAHAAVNDPSALRPLVATGASALCLALSLLILMRRTRPANVIVI